MPAESEILTRIKEMGRGSLFSPSDFYDMASRDAVASSLKRLWQTGTIRHLTHGWYDYPRQDEILGEMEPELSTLIKAIEKKENMTLYPSEAQAAYSFGLTQQVPMNPVFIALRPMKVSWGQHKLLIKKAPAKTLLIGNPRHVALSQALKWIGVENITAEQAHALRVMFNAAERADLLRDLRYMPLNQHKLIHFIADEHPKPYRRHELLSATTA